MTQPHAFFIGCKVVKVADTATIIKQLAVIYVGLVVVTWPRIPTSSNFWGLVTNVAKAFSGFLCLGGKCKMNST